MLSQAEWEKMYGRIEVKSVRQAFAFLLTWFYVRGEFLVKPRIGSAMADAHFSFADGRSPYSFIVSQKSLLWYFRKPSIEEFHSQEKIAERFRSAGSLRGGEMTTRIVTVEDAEAIIQFAEAISDNR